LQVIMNKYTQEDITSSWQFGFSNFVRLILLSLMAGAVVTVLWWSLQADSYSFYYLFQYFYSWLYCKIPFGCSQVALNNMQVLQPFIDRLGELLRSCGLVFSFSSFFSALSLRYYFVRYAQKLEQKQFVRGARLLTPQELNTEIDTARTNSGRLKYEAISQDLYLGRERVRLPHSLAFRHLAVVGVSGTGKTQLINSLLLQLESHEGQKCLILDLNGQYYSRFGQKGDKILSLQDERSVAWSFYNENVPAEFFAQALVEVNESDNNKFFSIAGRALMTDILDSNTSNEGVWQDLTSEPEKLLVKLQQQKGLSPSLLGAPKQAAGVIASASLELGFLKQLNHANESQEFFSLTDWVLSESEDWVFVIVKDIDLAATRPLLRLWVDLAVGGVLGREEGQDYPHLWIVGDELPGLGMLPSLGKLLSQGRKYKASVVAGYQVRGQIEQLYGKEGAREILAGLQTKIIFRTPDPSDSKDESLTLGEQETEEVSSNTQLGESLGNDCRSLQHAIKTRPVVMPSQLQNLADMKAYLKICEFDPCLISFDYYSLPAINKPPSQQIMSKSPVSEENLQWDINPDDK
jgi:Type IV secretion-system coupling protein DNA-binding domain